MIKRAADVLEKLAVGSLLIGLFQGKETTHESLLIVGFGILFLIGSFLLTNKERK